MRIWLPTIRAGSGADVYVMRLSEALGRQGVEALVTWLPHALELLPQLAPVRPPPGTAVVHGNSWSAFAFARPPLPLVTTVHHCVHEPSFAPYRSAAQALYHRAWIRPMEARSLACATRIAAVSEFTRHGVEAEFGSRDVRVIHNGVDTDLFVPAPPSSQNRPRGPFRLLFVGNWSRRKGADVLPGLMRRLGDGFELLYTTGLRGAVARRAFPPNARWAGPVADEAGMAELYRRCDALVAPSRLEGFGYAALEAMACGKPVVAFKASSLPEVVEDGVTGCLVPLDDVERLAEACRRLRDDPALAQRSGEAGRERATQRFSFAAFGRRYVRLYEEAAAGG